MKVKTLELILQRPATRAEVTSYEYVKEIFESKPPGERPRRAIDLLDEDDPTRNVVYYGTREEPRYNDIFRESWGQKWGEPGANQALKDKVRTMLYRYRKPEHVSFYVIGELENKGRSLGFRTLIARTQL